MKQDYSYLSIETVPSVTCIGLTILYPMVVPNPQGGWMVSSRLNLTFNESHEASECFNSILFDIRREVANKWNLIPDRPKSLAIHFRGFYIDTRYFQPTAIIPELKVIAFTTRPEIIGINLTLNLCFRTVNDTMLAYMAIYHSLNKGESGLDLSKFPCTWPKDLAKRIEEKYIDI